MHALLERCFLVLVLLPLARAVLVNSTIDDSFPDPRTGKAIAYTPEGAWTDGKDCRDQCSPRPDEQSLYRGTWHQATKNASASQLPSASIAFTGTAIYVFCVLPRTTSNPPGHTDLRFLLDNQVAGTYERTPQGVEGYDYDVLVFSKQGLANQQHFFVLQAGREGGPEATVLLDRIIYSYDDGKTSPGTLGGIVGGAIGGVAVLGILLALLYRHYSRRKKSRAPSPRPEGSESGSVEYPLVVPFTHTAAEWNQSQVGSGGSMAPSDSYATSPTSARSKRAQPSSPRPSQSQPSTYYGYSPDQVDIYDPYNNRVSFSSNPTTTTYIGPSSSTSGTASATVNTDTPPPYPLETIPLKPRKRSATESSTPTTIPRKE